jgi:hypothetical protein
MDGGRLRQALAGFEEDGAFTEEDYGALKRLLSGVGRVQAELLDGFIGLFFERHVLDDVRRGELLALPDDELVRAVRLRFKQVVAGGFDQHQAWHALSAHVRDALASLAGPSGVFPTRLSNERGFSSIAVEQAVAAVWGELGRRPTTREATGELFTRYLSGPEATGSEVTGSRELPAVMQTRLDAQRLARGILEVLSATELDLLRSQLDGEAVDAWAQQAGVSRATAYRMLARVKGLCRAEFEQRSDRTRLEVLDVIRGQLP